MKKLTVLCLVAIMVVSFATTASARLRGEVVFSTDTVIVE